jgi:hypothetical protein
LPEAFFYQPSFGSLSRRLNLLGCAQFGYRVAESIPFTSSSTNHVVGTKGFMDRKNWQPAPLFLLEKTLEECIRISKGLSSNF